MTAVPVLLGHAIRRFVRRAEVAELAERVGYAGDLCLHECSSSACESLRRLVALALEGT